MGEMGVVEFNGGVFLCSSDFGINDEYGELTKTFVSRSGGDWVADGETVLGPFFRTLDRSEREQSPVLSTTCLFKRLR